MHRFDKVDAPSAECLGTLCSGVSLPLIFFSLPWQITAEQAADMMDVSRPQISHARTILDYLAWARTVLDVRTGIHAALAPVAPRPN